MSKIKFKLKYALLGFVIGQAMGVTTRYAIDYYKDKSQKDQIKTEIKKLNQEIDSINNANIDATAKLSGELDILSAMCDNKYKAASDSLIQEMDAINKNAQSQVIARQRQIAELTKQR